MGFFQKIAEGLRKTRESMGQKIDALFGAFTKIDESLFEELEEALILLDVGAVTSSEICSRLRSRVKEDGVTDPVQVRGLLRDVIANMLEGEEALHISTKPSVILVIGVNGVGKTTTIGKLAANLKGEGKRVILGAADTFRAAAIEQLQVWADRAGVDLIKHGEGADPAAVVFDAIAAGKARNADVIICDTAGRLHNKKNLMSELAKFQETAGVTGIILTKLDGTARGGVVIGIKSELNLPVKYIGVGEQIDDLRPFEPAAFAAALFQEEKE